MADTNSFFAASAPRMLSVLRIVSGFLFMQHGLQKVFGLLTPPPPPGAPPPQPFSFDPTSLVGVAGLLELVGGLLLILGLFTRAAGFILSGMMAVAYFFWHAKTGGFWPVINRGELAALYCFVFLYFFFAGGGPWSVDYCIWGRRGGDGPAR